MICPYCKNEVKGRYKGTCPKCPKDMKNNKKESKKTGNNIKIKLANLANITPWGSYEYIYTDFDNGVIIKKLIIKEGHRFSLQSHSKRNEFWKITYKQRNSFVISKEDYILSKCISPHSHNFKELISIPPMTLHRAEALVGDLEIIEMSTFDSKDYSTLEEFESDIIRHHDDYGRS